MCACEVFCSIFSNYNSKLNILILGIQTTFSSSWIFNPYEITFLFSSGVYYAWICLYMCLGKKIALFLKSLILDPRSKIQKHSFEKARSWSRKSKIQEKSPTWNAPKIEIRTWILDLDLQTPISAIIDFTSVFQFCEILDPRSKNYYHYRTHILDLQ